MSTQAGCGRRPAVRWLLVLVPALAGMVACNRAVITLANASGLYCQESKSPRLVGTEPVKAGEFQTRDVCWPTGVKLQAGARYRVTLTTTEDWIDGFRDQSQGAVACRDGDGCLRADLLGVRDDAAIHGISGDERIPRAFALAIPGRRLLCQPWFKPIAQVGATGLDLHPLDPIGPVTRPVLRLESELVAHKTGELFLFVNDGVILSPAFTCEFYSNNHGKADVEVRRVDDPSL